MPFEKTYDYTHVPTIKRFSESDKFFRLLVGPFGSGKSSGCVAEIISRGIAQTPNSNGIRRTRWAAVRNCFDDQTEVLTEERGWVKFPDLHEDESIAILKDNKFIFEVPSFHFAAPYKGKMIGTKSETISFLVTPDHKLYTARINGRTHLRYDYAFHIAKDVWGKTNYEFRSDMGVWEGKEYDENLFEFLGFWFAEGHANTYTYDRVYNRMVVTQKKYTTYTENMLNQTRLKWRKEKRGKDNGFNYVIDVSECRELFEELKTCGLCRKKKVPQWMKGASRKCLQRFIHGYIMGDGHYRRNNRDATRSYTTSYQLANDIQEIGMRAGYVVTITRQKSGLWMNTFLQPCKYRPVPLKHHWYEQDYNGMVFCVEVSSHVVVTRRDHLVSLSSQTSRQLFDTTMKTFFEWLPPSEFGTYNVTNYQYTIDKIALADGTKVHIEVNFRPLDKPEDVRNLLSLELTGAWLNEIREMVRPIVDGIEGRVKRFPPENEEGRAWSGVIADTNPPDTESWIYDLFERQTKEDPLIASKYEVFRQPSGRSAAAENLPYLDDDYYTQLAIGKDPEYIKVYIDGDYGYTRDGKPVWYNYSDVLHCAEQEIQPIPGLPLILAFDFGMHNAAVIGQPTIRGGMNILYEWYEPDIGLRRFIRDIVRPVLFAKYRNMMIITTGDPTGIKRQDTDERSCFLELRANGFPVTAAPTNTWIPRYNAVDNYLTKMLKGKPAFQLSPNCTILRRGFKGDYKFKKLSSLWGGKSSERYSEVPDKTGKSGECSHVQDCMQYVCLTADKGVETARGYDWTSFRYQQPYDQFSRPAYPRERPLVLRPTIPSLDAWN